MTLREIVQESETKPGRAFDFTVLFLIVFSIITLTVETLPDLPPTVQSALRISEFVVVTVLFTIEYGLRVATSTRKASYVFSFYGVIDLVAILPFYLSLGVDLRAIRAVRLLRVFRLFKLTRYNRAMERFGKAIVRTREEAMIASASSTPCSRVACAVHRNALLPRRNSSLRNACHFALALPELMSSGSSLAF